MIDLAPLPSFIAVSAVIIIAPGSDVLLLIRAALAGGKRAGFASFAGVHTANLILTTVVACGLGAVVARHHNVLRVIQVVGGVYLLWLALGAARAVVVARRTRLLGPPEAADAVDGGETQPRRGLSWASRACFTRGFITNITNPKVLIFYLSFFPQFLGRANNTVAQMELLAWAFIAMAMVWEGSVVVLASRMQHLMDKPAFAITLDTLCSVVFAALGVAILLEAVR